MTVFFCSMARDRQTRRESGAATLAAVVTAILYLGCNSEAAVAADEENAAVPQASDQGLQEIVVTAQFRRQNLQDAPLAITAVNAALLEQRNQTALADVGYLATRDTWLTTRSGSNLLNRFYPISNFDLSGIGAGTNFGLAAPPREYSIQVEHKFQ